MVTTYSANAAGTAAGTSVVNQASVDFVVGGINQTDVNSNSDAFLVDQKVLFTVSEVGASATTVTPGSTLQVLTYSLSHTGNYVADFGVAASNDAGDDFDPSSSSVFVESGGGAGYQDGVDTATFVDELAADASIVVYVVSSIPLSATNGQDAIVHLQATAKAGGLAATQGADLVETAGAETQGSVDIVFADDAGSASGDAARDGKHSEADTYLVSSASIAVTKSSTVISDPINGGTNPKRIPGAIIEYTINVANSGGAAADNVAVTDALAAELTYSPGTLIVDGNAEDDNNTDGDDTPLDGGNPTAGSFSGVTVSASIFAIPAGQNKNIVFRAVVD